MTADTVLPYLSDGVIVLDGSNRVIEWLAASQKLFGWTPGEAHGRDINEMLQPRDANGNVCPIGLSPVRARMRAIKAVPEQEYVAVTKKGTDVWIGVTCSLERDGSGKIAKTYAVVRDISRRKRIDLQKSEVISAVSHELRSPLTSVKGFTSTLLHKWDRFDDDTKKHLLLTINTDADRVTRLIGELLDVSRLEAGRLQLRRQLVRIDEIAARVVDRIQPRSDRHVLTNNIKEGFRDVFADPDKVEQVLTNLVENAVKYTEAGSVTIDAEEEDSLVKVFVTDDGPGIPAENRSQVFGKFFRRGDRVRAENPSGTGLGLYISKGLVEAHGGRIWVEDAPGRGAVFAFTLPASEPQ